MLSYVNIFTDDIETLSDFYVRLFGLVEIEESRSPLFRGFKAGGCALGFSDRKAYAMLGLADDLENAGIKMFLTFEATDRDAVVRLTNKAVALGAVLIKAPFDTYYGWFQSVLKDPKGNVFRVNRAGK